MQCHRTKERQGQMSEKNATEDQQLGEVYDEKFTGQLNLMKYSIGL